MGKPWPERDPAPWKKGNGDPDGEAFDNDTYSNPGYGDVEPRAPAKSPNSDMDDR